MEDFCFCEVELADGEVANAGLRKSLVNLCPCRTGRRERPGKKKETGRNFWGLRSFPSVFSQPLQAFSERYFLRIG